VRRISGRIHWLSTAFLVAAAFCCPGAEAQTLFHFELPAQSLARSLEAIATATNIDVGFSSSQVAGFIAPSLKADLTLDGALTRVLAGTGLRSQYLDDHTILIAATESPTSDAAKMKRLTTKAIALLGEPADSPHSVNSVVDSSPQLILAQADTSAPDDATNSKKKERESTADQIEEIVVTGTHLRGEPSTSPLITIDQADIARSGYTTVGDVLRSIPQNFSGGQSPQTSVNALPPGSNPTGNNSFGSAPNLRGLGNTSTLTLVDGRRLPQDVQTGAVDVSLIPLAAIDHVDVVTDGASAIYGSDAVAGVVNIILKKNYDGAETSASTGIATEGGGFDWRASQLLGKTWDGGGGILVYEHEKQESVDARQREFTSYAATPYSLLPDASRNSLYVSGHQDLVSNLSVFIDAMYTFKDGEAWQSLPPVTYYITNPAVRSYLATAGLRATLPHKWIATLFGSWGQQKDEQYTYYSYLTPVLQANTSEAILGRTRTFELDADGPVFEFPTGPLRAAIGVGERHESYLDRHILDSEVVAAGDRSVNYFFGEFAAPLVSPSQRTGLMRLDLNISARYERYSDFGSKTEPKVGVLYIPSGDFKIRASASKSFRVPTFTDLYGIHNAYLDNVPDPHSPTGTSNILELAGGNPNVRPETATSETVSAELNPARLEGFRATTTYFHIDYRNRIGALQDYYTALSEPSNAGFVVRDPSSALQQQILGIAGPGRFSNYTGGPYDPATLAAFVNETSLNIGRVWIDGVDGLLNYTIKTPMGSIGTFLNATYMDLSQKVTAQSPEIQLAGTSFSPPHFRARGGATWTVGSMSATGILNFISHESNIYQPENPPVASWTTIDAQLSYAHPIQSGPFAGLRIALSVQNLLDRNPPFLSNPFYSSGLNYDSTNASPLGRFVSLQVSKVWW
jgi:iron complex outermembrane receptor protein